MYRFTSSSAFPGVCFFSLRFILFRDIMRMPSGRDSPEHSFHDAQASLRGFHDVIYFRHGP